MAVEKRLSLNEIRARAAKFAHDYRNVVGEKQHTGDFWKAFMACFGIDDTYLHGVTFEYPARRSDTGGLGYIDVFMPSQYLIEQKSDGKITTSANPAEQSNAEKQAYAYLTGGDITPAQMPRHVITSDFSTIQITDLSLPKASAVRTRTFLTRDLPDYVELFLFVVGEDPAEIVAQDQAEASIQAARIMGDLYAAMTGDADTTDVVDADEEDETTEQASILLTRLLFLLFGDDAGLWESGLFQRFIRTRTSPDGSDLGAQLSALFDVLNTPERRRSKHVDEAMAAFPYVNGDLYAHGAKLAYFDTKMRYALLKACDFNWSRISPAVFGSLFQTVKSKAARRAGGEHYTSEENILKTLRPLFLDQYRAKLDAANTKPQLEALHEELKGLRYVDAACGCGNFLIVAYREMRALELDLLVKLRSKQGRAGELMLNPEELLNVRLDQFSGIEINWWPAKIASVAMFLVDHQANQVMARTLGLVPHRLPIDIEAEIHHTNALTAHWDTLLPGPDHTVYVFGNPPFAGRKERTRDQARELLDVWGIKKAGHLDYVTAWHAKALTYMAGRRGEFGFVTTNSISQGEQVPELFPQIADKGWRIKFAHRTFKWDSESRAREKAAVHCVIVGFTRDPAVKPRLYDYPDLKGRPVELKVTKVINGYLADGPWVFARKRSTVLSPSLPVVEYGSMPNDGGHLLIGPDEYDQVMADPVAAQYVRKFVGARELINDVDRWCLWLVDMKPSDVNASPVLKARLKAVRETRLASTNPDTWPKADTPHLFWFIHQPTVPYLCMPSTFSDNRPYATVARFGREVITSNAANVCEDPDGFAFAVVSSSMFLTWQRTVGGRLKSDPRFTNTLVWNTLPLPKVDAAQRKQIIAAGQTVLTARAAHPDRSLAEHYNPLAMDPGLLRAHRDLDKLVDTAFGAGRGVKTEAVRQQVLFERYAEMTNP